MNRWAAVRAELDRIRPPCAWPDGRTFRESVKHVVLLSSSSRGGSSVLAEYLRSSRAMLHLRGELNAFLALHGLGHPDSGTGSDALGAEHVDERADAFAYELATDVGRPALGSGDPRDYLAALRYRLRLQWPDVAIDPDVLRDAALRAPRPLGSDAFHAVLLSSLAAHSEVHPDLYDLSASLVRTYAPRLATRAGPPGPAILEEPPFVCTVPWEPATPGDLEQLPLLLKTPSNAYRLPFFERLFPNARVRVLHLTRNPAASINGLWDGWRYPRGFFSHDLGIQLDIQDYTRTAGPWSGRWWKFDLPPGWRAECTRPLAHVAAFQWLAAHRAIFDFTASRTDVLRIAFEDLLGLGARNTLDAMFRWLEIEPDAPIAERTVGQMPHVMVTDQPRARRWFERQAIIEPVLRRPDVMETAVRLGYKSDPSTWE
jgi:hypothetical protein